MNPAKWLLCRLDDVDCNPILTRIFTFNFSAAVQLKPAVTLKTDTQHFLIQYTLTPLQHQLTVPTPKVQANALILLTIYYITCHLADAFIQSTPLEQLRVKCLTQGHTG